MKRLNIYLYSTQDITQMGGGGNSSSTTFKYLNKAGHHVTFFKSILEMEKALIKSKPDIILHHNIKDLDKVYPISKKLDIPLLSTINNLITCQTGVHIKYDSNFGVPCFKCSFFKGLVCQIKEKNVRPLNEKLSALFFYPLRYYNRNQRIKLLNDINGIIAISPTLKKLLRINGVKNKIYVCNQPIDDDMLIKPQKRLHFDKKTIFYQGGGEPFKGIRVLIEAFIKLKQDDTKLLIAGDIRKENNLNIKLIQHKYPNIKFLGQVSVDDIKKYYYSSDIFVFPSLWFEAFGRGWAEAACCGKPIITFRGRGGSSDFLSNNVNALVIEPRMNDIVLAMDKLLNDGKLRNKLAKNVKEFAKQNLVASKVADKLTSIYDEVLKL